MLSSATRKRLRVGGASTASILLAVAAFAGMASAHTGKPASISATVNGTQVSVQGSWTWASQATATLQYRIGYAIDWGDVTSGNAVGTFHIGDGTPATNVVLTNTSPKSGASGAWGPATHTYAAPGTYTVCVIMYDVGPVSATSEPPSGQFSLVAGGTGHNPDNSVEELMSPPTQCTQVQAAAAATPTPTATATPTATTTASGTTPATPAPTETPLQTLLGVTAVPSLASLPPTSTSTTGSGSGSGTPMGVTLILLALSMLFGVVAIKPLAESRSRR